MSIGKVYRIDCGCGCNKFYIGSTTQKLSQRLANHKSASKRGTASKLYIHMREVDNNNFLISEIEKPTTASKPELKALENKWIIATNAIKLGFNGRLESPKCQHNKRRHRCVECEGISICEHKKRKSRCITCNQIKCILCNKPMSKDYINRHYKSKAHIKKLNDEIISGLEKLTGMVLENQP